MRPAMGLLLFPLLLAAACKPEAANVPEAAEMTEDALGYFCQMQLAEHDGQKGRVHLEGHPAPLFFSQVRELLAYMHMPEESHAVQAAYVQDMSRASWSVPGGWIRAEDAL